MALLYQELGQVLHREFQGWRAGILTGNVELGRAVGLRSHKRYGFHNGAIDVQLLLFEMTSDNRLADRSGHTRTTDSSPPPNKAAPLSEGAAMLLNRLRKNHRRLKPWLRNTGTSCYRLYDADMPEYAVAIDIYEGHPHVAEYAAPKKVDPDGKPVSKMPWRQRGPLRRYPRMSPCPPNVGSEAGRPAIRQVRPEGRAPDRVGGAPVTGQSA